MDTENKVNFIPCLAWVKRGVAKSNPEKVSCFNRRNYIYGQTFSKVQLTKEELVQIINQTKGNLK